MRWSTLLECALSCLILSLPGGLRAQGLGTITGIVKDASGAVIPGASVTVTNQETGVTTRVSSLADGAYRTPQLKPGNYTVSAEHPGFKRLDLTGLKLDVDSTLTQDLSLEVGVVTESVKVTAQTNLVETASGELGTTVSLTHVREMAMADRNVYRLVNMVPGAFLSNASGQAAGTPVYIGGSRTYSAPRATIDGIDNSRSGLGIGNIEMSPPLDSMQEFKVEVTSYSAAAGRSANGQIAAVTRSGTNKLHGSFYEYLRNDKFDANGWGNDSKPSLRRNNYGATVGGPIIRNRTFFFFNWDGLRQHQGVTATRNVGLPEWRTGDFSKATRQQGNTAVQQVIYDPTTGTGTPLAPVNSQPFPGNIIPTGRLDPVAVKAVQFFPNANRTPDNPFTQAGNWQLNNINLAKRDFFIGRVDHELTANTRLFYRHMVASPDKTETPPLPGWGDADTSEGSVPDRHQNASLNVTHIFSPTFFANATVGFNRTRPANVSGAPGKEDYAKLLGIPNAPPNGFPQFTGLAGGAVPISNLGFQRAIRFAAFTTTDYLGNLTKIRGSHTITFGVQYTRFNGNVRVVPSAGTYNFSGRFTAGYNAAGTQIANTGINFADFLLGRLESVSAEQIPTIGKRIQNYSGYIQDDWRVTKRLMLNLGLRYETETPAHGVNDYFSNFDPFLPNPLAGTGDIPAGAMGVTLFQNRNGNGEDLYRWNKKNFAPRFGFAYRLTDSGNTVVRGGFGIYYGIPIVGAIVEFGNSPFGETYTLSYPVPFSLRDGLPSTWVALPTLADWTPAWGTRGTKFAQSSFSPIDTFLQTNYSMNFNLTVQRQWKDIAFEASYLGNLTRHAPGNAFNINAIPPNLLSQTSINQRLRRPYPILASDTGTISIGTAGYGHSNYQAFLFKSERRFANGLGWVVAYTFTKWIDDLAFSGGGNPSNSNDAPQNIYNLKGERSLSTGSFPHRLVLSPIYQLPFGKGRQWMNRGGVLNGLFGGWQVCTIAMLQSGGPFGVTVLNGGNLYLGDSTQTLRPNLIADPNLKGGQGSPAVGIRGIQWFDPSAFAVPARFTYGSAARTLPGIYGPGLVNFDSMLAKTFTIRERWRAQFRWEALNMTNTPAWSTPSTVLGNASFGAVTSAGTRRIMQLGLKLSY